MRMVYDESIGDYMCYGEKALPKVTSVTPNRDYTLDVVFSTGERKKYDARLFLDADPDDPLHDLNLFMRAHVDGFSVAWTDEIDIAPEELYESSSAIS